MNSRSLGTLTVVILCCVAVGAQSRKKAAPRTSQQTTRQKVAVDKTRQILGSNTPAPTAPGFDQLKSKANRIDRTYSSSDPKIWAEQWQFSREVLEAYYEANKDNLVVAPFADTLRQLLYLSFRDRAKLGGFVRETFVFMSVDIIREWDYWRRPITEQENVVLFQKMQDCVGLSVLGGFLETMRTGGDAGSGATVALAGIDLCEYEVVPLTATGFVGNHHFDKHLAPAFFQSFRNEFSQIARNNSAPGQVEKLIKERVETLRAEHEWQLKLNKESYARVGNFPGLDVIAIALAREFIPPRAAALREGMLQTAIFDLKENHELDASVADSILSYIAGRDQSSGYTFPVVQFLNTRMGVEKGDVLNISATGNITLGFNPALFNCTPAGIGGFQSYSLIRDIRHGALLGRIIKTGNERWQLIGKKTTMVADYSGVLEFMVNDGDSSNNVGSYQVTVIRNRR